MPESNDPRHAPHDGLRVPPMSVDAEQSVLGGLMLSPLAINDINLSADDFYRRDHRLIFNAITELSDNGKPFDAVTVGEWIESHHLTEQIGSTGYLIELASTVPSAANITAYADIVRDKATLRRIIEAGTTIVNAGFDAAGAPAATVYADAIATITNIESRVISADAEVTDLFSDYMPPRLNPDWLPPALSDFVFQASEVKSCHPEILFVSALSACAAATSDDFKVMPRPNEPGFKESARLWVMVVGSPSQKKTPAMKLAMSGLSRMNVEMISKNAAAESAYEKDMQVYRLAEKNRARAEAKGDGLPESVPMPERPQAERIITSDFTVEGVSRLLMDNPRGLLCYTDELATWFGKMGKYAANGGTDDRAQWLQFYEGGPKPIDRAGKTVLVPNASVSVIGAIQPDKMRALATSMTDDGLLQRFIVAVLPPGALPDCEKPEPTHLIKAYAELITQIYRTSGESSAGLIEMSPEAVEVRREMDRWRTVVSDSDGLPSMLRSAVMKYEGLFPRLCMTYHAIGCAASRRFPTSLPISGSTAKRVAALMKHWIFPNHLAFFAGIMGASSPGFLLARAIGDYLLTTDEARVTRRSITHGCNAWRAAPDWQQNSAIAALESAGWITAADPGRKNAQAWIINPVVRRQFQARASAAKARRTATTETLAALRQAAAARKSPPPDNAAASG